MARVTDLCGSHDTVGSAVRWYQFPATILFMSEKLCSTPTEILLRRGLISMLQLARTAQVDVMTKQIALA